MSDLGSGPIPGTNGGVRVRYWAAARAAAGTAQEDFPLKQETTLGALLEDIRARHLDQPRLKDVIAVCSVLVGDRPVGTADADGVVVRPGQTVDLLPPFAGG